MWPFKRKSAVEPAGATAVEPAAATAVAERPVEPLADAGAAELRAELDRLAAAGPAQRTPETEARALTLRYLLGLRLVDEADDAPRFAEPDTAALPTADGLPEIAAADLTPGLLRAGILRDGCLLVRGLIARDAALQLAAGIDRSFAERERALAGGTAAPGMYAEWDAGGRLPADAAGRDWIRQGGGVLAGDAPLLASELFALLRHAGLDHLVEGYLGEPPLISYDKTTLRKATPDVAGAWHQDGRFMGPVRALNLWLSLSRCGDQSPGLDLVPRRLEEYVVTQTEEAMLDYVVSQSKAEGAAGERGILRPIFEPGDALLFDEKFLHKTGSDPSMPKPRYAVESWFFGASAFPEYVPLAV